MEIVLSSRSGSLSDSFAENTSEDEGEMGARNCGVASSVYRSGTLRPCSQFKLVKLLSGELFLVPRRCFCCCPDDGLQLKLNMFVAGVGSATVTKKANQHSLQPPSCLKESAAALQRALWVELVDQ